MADQSKSSASEHDFKIGNAVTQIENLFRPLLRNEKIDPVVSERLGSLLRIFLQQDMGSQKEVSRLDATILISDIRGFTSLVEEIAPDIVISILNQYFATMCTIINQNFGRIDKFMGDSILAVFNTPNTDYGDVLNALKCSAEMQIAMDDLNRHFMKYGLPPLFMGIGINTGKVMAGMIGSELHSEYTVIGDEVNLASRIEAYSLRGQVLLSQNSYQNAKQYIKTGDGVEVYVKGKREPVVLYELKSINRPFNIELPRREERKSPRVNVKIPFEFQCITSKTVESEIHKGMILDISYNGLKVDLPIKLKLFSEIKLTISFFDSNEHYSNIYGKIVNSRETENKTFQSGLEFSSLGMEAAQGIKKYVQYRIQSEPD